MKRSFLIFTIVAIVAVLLAGTVAVQSQSGNTWQVQYYPNANWQGNPVYSQFVSWLNFNWGTAAPGPGMPGDYWTARATTDAFFYGGPYRFTTTADDEVTLVIDGVSYINTINQGQSGKTQTVDVNMSQGMHNVRVDFREFTGAAYLYVTWDYLKPGQGTPPPPPSTPRPPSCQNAPPASAPSVQTKFGDYNRCIQNGLHQAECFQSDGAWDSPNVGSIQMEPKIAIWGNCSPADSDYTWVTDCSVNPPVTKSYRCSKTLAGYFPR